MHSAFPAMHFLTFFDAIVSLRSVRCVCFGMCRKYRYDLTTALYMLDPFERAIFNGIVLCILVYTFYGIYLKTLHPLFESYASNT